MNQDATAAAESSTAPVEPIAVENFNDEQRDSWIKTGELPIKPTSDDSATSKPGDATDSGADAKKAESGTAKQDTAKRKGAEGRKEELGAEIQSLLEKRAVLKDEGLWNEFEEYRKTKGAKKDEKPAESSTAPPSEVKQPEAPVRPVRPKRAEFASDEAYETAMDKHEDAMLEYPAKKAEFDTAKAHADKTKSEIEQHNKKVEESWKTRVDKSKQEHEDFEAIAFAKDLPVPWGSPVDEWILQSDVGAEMLYHFGHNRDELKRINALSHPAQHRELAKLEDKLAGTSPKKDPPEEKPKTKAVTDALPPPREIGGKGTAPEDEEAAALKNGDVDRYMEIANKKELAARRAGHR